MSVTVEEIGAATVAEVARMLRELRRRQARQQDGPILTCRQLAARTGWSHGIIGAYLSGRVLPPTDRFDVLVRLLGATPAEQGRLATIRDSVEERRRMAPSPYRWAVPRQLPAPVVGFTGRSAPLAELDALLDTRAAAVVVSAIGGTAGVGRTNLEYWHTSHVTYSPAPGCFSHRWRGAPVRLSDVPQSHDRRSGRSRSRLAGNAWTGIAEPATVDSWQSDDGARWSSTQRRGDRSGRAAG